MYTWDSFFTWSILFHSHHWGVNNPWPHCSYSFILLKILKIHDCEQSGHGLFDTMLKGDENLNTAPQAGDLKTQTRFIKWI